MASLGKRTAPVDDGPELAKVPRAGETVETKENEPRSAVADSDTAIPTPNKAADDNAPRDGTAEEASGAPQTGWASWRRSSLWPKTSSRSGSCNGSMDASLARPQPHSAPRASWAPAASVSRDL